MTALNNEQAGALEVSIATMIGHIGRLERQIVSNKKHISGESAMLLERGNYYKRHMKLIEADEQVIAVLRKSIEEVHSMLKTAPLAVKVGETMVLIEHGSGDRYEGTVLSFTAPNSVSLCDVLGFKKAVMIFNLDEYTIEVPREADEEVEYL